MRKVVSILSLMCLLAFASPTAAQQIQTTRLVDCPTAGLLPRGSFDLDLRVFSLGGLLAGISAGVTDRLAIGLSFGGENIIGTGDADWNPRPEVMVRYRVIEEGYGRAALACGYDSQGFGAYSDSLGRYEVKSKGFYAVLSKSYSLIGAPMGFHLGANYSMEKKDDDDDLSFYIGFDASINEELSFVGEYDLALNDDRKNEAYGAGRGYVNLGARWTFARGVFIEIDFRNVADNLEDTRSIGRELRFVYQESF